MVVWLQLGGIFMARNIALNFQLNRVQQLSSVLQFFSMLCLAYKWKSPLHTGFLKQLVKSQRMKGLEWMWDSVITGEKCREWLDSIADTFISIVFIPFLVNFNPSCQTPQISKIKGSEKLAFFPLCVNSTGGYLGKLLWRKTAPCCFAWS